MIHAYLPRELPKPLQGLIEMALDLRWSSSPSAGRLWRMVDEDTWERSGNPWLVLQDASTHRLEDLAKDKKFLEELRGAQTMRNTGLQRQSWYVSSII